MYIYEKKVSKYLVGIGFRGLIFRQTLPTHVISVYEFSPILNNHQATLLYYCIIIIVITTVFNSSYNNNVQNYDDYYYLYNWVYFWSFTHTHFIALPHTRQTTSCNYSKNFMSNLRVCVCVI